jgi:hypothetical protein
MNLRSIGIAGLIIGILFKFLHWPGANIILLTSAVLTLVTLLILLVTKPGPWSVQIQRPIWIFGSLAVALIGVIFKLMHWPGANIELMLGMLGLASWFLVTGGRPVRPA